MSVSATTSRSDLLAEARQEWLATQQRKVDVQPKAEQKPVTVAPTDSVLISEDAQLQRELAALQSVTDTATQLLEASVTSRTA